MIPSSFEYQRAASVQEALSLLGEDAQLLAGGHSLIPAMKLRLNQPGTLVDISRIEALKQISESGQHLVIGAAATHGQIAASALVQQHCAFLAAGAGEIGDIQVRNKGTIGGSLAHADPAADWPGLLIAAGAEIEMVGSGGSRKLKAEDFFQGFFETALEEGEIITAVHVPKMHADQRARYEKFAQPASRYAIVGVAVVLTFYDGSIREARVGVNGLADCAYLDTAVIAALENQKANADTAATAAQKAGEGKHPMSDHYASEKYRANLARVVTKRAINACL